MGPPQFFFFFLVHSLSESIRPYIYSLTRALEEETYYALLICFHEYLKNDTPCVQILTSQVKRSGHQVRPKSDVHSETGFKLEDGAVGTVLVRMFSNFQDEVL